MELNPDQNSWGWNTPRPRLRTQIKQIWAVKQKTKKNRIIERKSTIIKPIKNTCYYRIAFLLLQTGMQGRYLNQSLELTKTNEKDKETRRGGAKQARLQGMWTISPYMNKTQGNHNLALYIKKPPKKYKRKKSMTHQIYIFHGFFVLLLVDSSSLLSLCALGTWLTWGGLRLDDRRRDRHMICRCSGTWSRTCGLSLLYLQELGLVYGTIEVTNQMFQTKLTQFTGCPG